MNQPTAQQVEQRVDQLLTDLTVEENISLCGAGLLENQSGAEVGA